MSSILLHQLTPDNLAVELHLRLIHAWKSGDPSKPNSFFGFGTHWIDSEGKTIQGDSHKNFITFLQSRLEVGSVYKITGFGLRPPRRSFRTSTYPHCLDLTPTTQFHLQPPTTPPFRSESLKYIEFEDLSGRLHPLSAYLTNFVGKLIGGGEPGHIQRFNVVAPFQNLFVSNERGVELRVSLWGDLGKVVDGAAHCLGEDSNPTIIAFVAFRITASLLPTAPPPAGFYSTRLISTQLLFAHSSQLLLVRSRMFPQNLTPQKSYVTIFVILTAHSVNSCLFMQQEGIQNHIIDALLSSTVLRVTNHGFIGLALAASRLLPLITVLSGVQIMNLFLHQMLNTSNVHILHILFPSAIYFCCFF